MAPSIRNEQLIRIAGVIHPPTLRIMSILARSSCLDQRLLLQLKQYHLFYLNLFAFSIVRSLL